MMMILFSFTVGDFVVWRFEIGSVGFYAVKTGEEVGPWNSKVVELHRMNDWKEKQMATIKYPLSFPLKPNLGPISPTVIP